MIFGVSGSGKSTFATNLCNALSLAPLYHLDKYFFTNNWVERDYEEFLSIQQSFVDQDAWIIDGNAIRSLEMRYSKADMVLYFNYPLWLCYYRVFKRRLVKNSGIADRAFGCDERISLKLLKYMWTFGARVNAKIMYLRDKYPKVKFVEIKNDDELELIKNKLLAKIIKY